MVTRQVGFVLGALTLVGCATGFSRAEAVDSYLQSNPEASTIVAECVVDRLAARYEDEPIDESDLAGLEAQLTAEQVDPDFVVDQFRAEYRCGLTEGVERQLELEFIARGESPTDAACLAKELGADLSDTELDVLLTGEITDEFYGSFFDATVACTP